MRDGDGDGERCTLCELLLRSFMVFYYELRYDLRTTSGSGTGYHALYIIMYFYEASMYAI
jgi:hypothetical protein